MLRVEQVTKKYGDFLALDNVSLELKNGVYGLLAPNGAGKTTLMKMLVTLMKPTSGRVLFKGEEILKLDEQYRSRIGYLPQHFGYYKHYTPTQYLLYLAALKGMPKEAAKARIEEVLDQVALLHVKKKKMKKFSGGMIQRVGIAQALLNDPTVLVLDEPTAGLDPKERARFRHLLSELGRTRIVLLSTHIVSDVESIANEIIMIKNQRLLYKESVGELCERLNGRVYEGKVDFERLPIIRRDHVVLAEKQEQNGMLVRLIAEEAMQGWEQKEPQLEDVFLYEYREEEVS
ncbi:ABC transporter ATP-binding protein [Paenalkalicoccus suaedae]|uniref:ABC transporter ATP-binding protein n=1 Tax=Paenalkalicoccus suaedae TaxID=2592382 RepID=A0A859FB30_9BACI|nr:ABC transporter ATP-binding protein [Paenalkalicoccus suaedae]QKS69992.1 ABC transporter ATP-binding protein [Paenalkalicoccus suaedae]